MNIQAFLADLLYAVLVGSIPTISVYAVKYIKTRGDALAANTSDTKTKSIISSVTDMITDAVIKTNQTLVNSLKASGKFDTAAQVAAFNATKTTILSMLTADAKVVLGEVYGDASAWIETKIESTVNSVKQPITTTPDAVTSTEVTDTSAVPTESVETKSDVSTDVATTTTDSPESTIDATDVVTPAPTDVSTDKTIDAVASSTVPADTVINQVDNTVTTTEDSVKSK